MKPTDFLKIIKISPHGTWVEILNTDFKGNLLFTNKNKSHIKKIRHEIIAAVI